MCFVCWTSANGCVYALAAATPAARAAAAAAGSPTSRAAACAPKARERNRAVRLPPPANSRMPSIAARGRESEPARVSNTDSALSAQSAAQPPMALSDSRLSVKYLDSRSIILLPEIAALRGYERPCEHASRRGSGAGRARRRSTAEASAKDGRLQPLVGQRPRLGNTGDYA